jgi:virginiamycin B lyase
MGVFTQYAVPHSFPWGITSGPDKALWFVSFSPPGVGRVTTSGQLKVFPFKSNVQGPLGITAGPDGALWFTAASGIGRITTTGQLTTFPNAPSDFGIATGSDGALWYSADSAIGRITTTGVVATYPVPGGAVRYVSSGPDKNIWFTQHQTCLQDWVDRISIVSMLQRFRTVNCSGPTDIASGPDGALWFTETTYDHIDRITVDGRITRFQLPRPHAAPYGIASGPDGGMWFTERQASRIGRIQAI